MNTVVLLGLVVLAAILVPHEVQACIGSGVCGGGGQCYSPPPVSCGGGCSPGYSCGHYGCARRRARAHGSNTVAVEAGEPQLPVLFGSQRYQKAAAPLPKDPNQMFLECCEDRGLPDACLSKCNFNKYTKESLMSMYFKTDACPIEAAAELQYCAARGRDHRACCARNGVQTTLSGQKCLTFCDQRPGNVTQLDFSYASCYDRFEQMKGCFWHSAISEQQQQFQKQ